MKRISDDFLVFIQSCNENSIFTNRYSGIYESQRALIEILVVLQMIHLSQYGLTALVPFVSAGIRLDTASKILYT